MVAQAEEKWKRRFQEVTDEKEEANMKLAELQGKVSIALLVQEIICFPVDTNPLFTHPTHE